MQEQVVLKKDLEMLVSESIAVLLISANTTCTKPPSAIICAYSF